MSVHSSSYPRLCPFGFNKYCPSSLAISNSRNQAEDGIFLVLLLCIYISWRRVFSPGSDISYPSSPAVRHGHDRISWWLPRLFTPAWFSLLSSNLIFLSSCDDSFTCKGSKLSKNWAHPLPLYLSNPRVYFLFPILASGTHCLLFSHPNQKPGDWDFSFISYVRIS